MDVVTLTVCETVVEVSVSLGDDQPTVALGSISLGDDQPAVALGPTLLGLGDKTRRPKGDDCRRNTWMAAGLKCGDKTFLNGCVTVRRAGDVARTDLDT
mmetsp:Transcript_55230/g.85885  ORF Transcript_55230/g.85885 Transcript_55230/m.85885 type:complete len:99 (+) Transcript_55230:471-767(+)